MIYQFTAGISANWTWSLCNSAPDWDSSIQIREGGACPGTNCVAADDDSCLTCSSPYEATVTAALTAGTHYFVIVDSFTTGGSSNFELSWSVVPVSTGACCGLPPSPNCSCSVQSVVDCGLAGGFYKGDGTTCGGDRCDCNANGICDQFDFLPSGGAPKDYAVDVNPDLTIPDAGISPCGTCSSGQVCIDVNGDGNVGPSPDRCGVQNSFNVPDSGTITDVDVALDILHTWEGDLIVIIEHGGEAVTLNAGTAGNGNLDGVYIFDDSANGTIHVNSEVDVVPGSYKPDEILAQFNGMNKQGNWTMSIADDFGPDGGMWRAWSLAFINNGTPPVATDCNGDTIPDSCQLSGNDCNGNSIPDDCELAGNDSIPVGGDGIPDGCNCLVHGDCGPGETCEPCTNVCVTNGCPCTTQADCRNNLCPDDNACNHAYCVSGTCLFTCERYGDVQPPGGNGQVNLDDILCLLAGFANLASCPNADIIPCGGNAIINLDDILSVLGAFAGANPCACVENCLPGGGNPPLCGSTQPFDGGGDANGGVAVGGCCNLNLDCQDGLFCSGLEICTFGVCADGPNPCPAGYCDEADDACTGACCLVGACQLVSEVDCEALQGIYQGDGVACPTIGPLGACCFAAVGCLVRTEEACSCQGGSFLGDGTSCPANDPDTDCLTNAVDNCDNDYNPLQDDMDLDGVGDECDNCPTKANPGQEDANGMCGGDACETSALFSHCDVPFTPAPGIDPVLLSPAYPHPLLGERVHAVLQLCNALMPIDRQALMGTGLQFQGGFSHHELIITATQSELSYIENVLMTMKCLEGTVGEACAVDSDCDTSPGQGDGDCGTHLPFVRAIFPLPVDCRIGPGLDDGLDHDVHVIFYEDVPSAVANQILLDHGATNILPGGAIQGTHIVNTWAARLTAAEISLLASEEPVLSISLAGVPEGLNDGSRLAIGVNTVQAPPFCAGLGCTGAAIVMAEIDTGWAAGDGTWGAAPVGGAHGGLMGSVIARDRLPLGPLPGPAAPAGCGAAILCDNPATACSECFYADHATHVAGTMMGSGFMNFAMRGMAPSAQNISYKFPYSALELACELTDSAVNYGARVANNSWGMRPPGTPAVTYGAFTQAYDRVIRNRPSEAVVFAAGNSQCFRGSIAVALPPIYTVPVCTPLPAPVPLPPAIAEPPASVRNRFFTVLGNVGQTAKNTLVIGAVDSGSPSAPGNFGKMTTFSSWGPTSDGRIKPDLVAAGSENGVQDCFAYFPPVEQETDQRIMSTVCSGVFPACPNFDPANPDFCTTVTGDMYGPKRGTSMSAPAVSGGIGLLMQQQGNIGLVPGDTPLDSDSIKALLVHTAIDLPVHFPLGGAFMSVVAPCPGSGAGTECWPVPPVMPGVVQDGPDYVNGWGLVSISGAANKLITRNPPVTLRPSGCPAGVAYANLPFNSPLPIGGNPAGLGILGCATAAIWDWVGYITVPPGTTQLRITIAWDDVAAVPPPDNAVAPLLVNNLDLIATPGNGMGATFMPTGLEYYSWRLDPSCPHLQAVRPAVPIGGPQYADNRNNVEQIIVDNPAAGGWRIVVQAAGLAMPPQQFSIIISMPPNFP